jgi:hypothetical protein
VVQCDLSYFYILLTSIFLDRFIYKRLKRLFFGFGGSICSLSSGEMK